MNTFDSGDRVCFLGDSITAGGYFIAQIFDQYVKTRPELKVQMYNCGISGGSTGSALKYLESDLLPYDPTRVVLMLGINDIDRGSYGAQNDGKPEMLERRERAIVRYRAGMYEIAERLAEKHIKTTFCTPTPYDEGQDVQTENLAGCEGALVRCGEICRELAEKYGGDTVDFNGCLEGINRDLQARDARLSLIREDRVHPKPEGHCVMARYFLFKQGFEFDEPTAGLMLTKEMPMTLSPRMEKWYKTTSELRAIWNVEWLLLQGLWGRPDEEKLEFIGKYIEKGEFPGEFWESIAKTYYDKKAYQQLLTLKTVRLGAEMYY